MSTKQKIRIPALRGAREELSDNAKFEQYRAKTMGAKKRALQIPLPIWGVIIKFHCHGTPSDVT